MKILIAVVALLSGHAFACSPALPATAQLSKLNLILSSKAFRAQISAAQARDYGIQITKIAASGSEVTLSDGCTIVSSTVYKPVTDQGMCPELDKVVSETLCQ